MTELYGERRIIILKKIALLIGKFYEQNLINENKNYDDKNQ